MKKSILNLKGVQELSKNEQKSVNGGIRDGQCFVYSFSEAECADWMGRWYPTTGGCLITKPVFPEGDPTFILC